MIHFPAGIPGFENSKKFIIISQEEYQPFHWLQCVDGDPIRFAIINPLAFRPDYDPKINGSDLASLDIKDAKDLLLYVIVTLKSPLEESSANLMGPLFINLKKKVGKQVILEDNQYSVRERILD